MGIEKESDGSTESLMSHHETSLSEPVVSRSSQRRWRFMQGTCFVLALSNIVLVSTIFLQSRRHTLRSKTQSATDYFFGKLPQKDVLWEMQPEFVETQPKVFYNESGADEVSAWASIYPSGWVEVESTPEHVLEGGAPLSYWGDPGEKWEDNSQAWATTLMHQIHCLGMMKSTWHKMMDGDSINNRRHDHFPHCIEYLRQAVMCQADLTLEPAIDPMKWPIGTSGWGVVHQCKDWDAVLSAIKQRAVLRNNGKSTWSRLIPRP